MPIPALTPQGYLPPGIHLAHINDVFDSFVDGKSQRRLDIWNGLMNFVRNFSGIVPCQNIYFDGSYITGKIEPNDIEVIIEFDPAHWLSYANNIHMHHDSIKATYLVDVWPQMPGQPHDFRQFFQYIRNEEKNSKGLPPSTQKGILLVQGVAI